MNYIRQYRKAAGLTMKELGALCDCTEGAISNYERGTREPGYETLLKIAETLNTSVDNLLRTEKPAPDWNRHLNMEDIKNWLVNEASKEDILEFIQLAADRLK